MSRWLKKLRMREMFLQLLVVSVLASCSQIKPSPTPTATATPLPTPTATQFPGLFVPEDYSSIQLAIEGADEGDEIIVSPGTYRENIDFLGKNLIVRSTSPDNPDVVASTIIKGVTGTVVAFQSGETISATLAGFTITSGSGVGISVTNNSSPTIRDNIIAGTGQDGIFVGDNSSPRIENNSIGGNLGGGITVELDSSPTIKNNTILENGNYGIFVAESSPSRIENNFISGNFGSGITVELDSSPEIIGNTIRDNVAEVGGGISVYGNSSPLIKGNNILNNEGTFVGGGIFVSDNSSATIEGNEIIGNSSESGGGLALGGTAITVKDNTIRGNHGGGIQIGSNASPTIATIEGNRIIDNLDRGGIFVFGNSSPFIFGNTISRNVSGGGGGIFVIDTSSPTIEGNTISENRSFGTGGGIRLNAGTSAAVAKNEFLNNHADEVGGAIWVSSSATLVLNTPDDNIYQGNEPDDVYISSP